MLSGEKQLLMETGVFGVVWNIMRLTTKWFLVWIPQGVGYKYSSLCLKFVFLFCFRSTIVYDLQLSNNVYLFIKISFNILFS